MKRILFVGMCANKGGIETFMKNVFLRLEGHGFHFDFINMGKKELAYSTMILNHGGTIRHVYIPYGIRGRILRPYKIKQFFSKFKGYYDVIHINSLTINDICWIKIAKRYGVKSLIIQSHMSNFKNNLGIFRRIISGTLAYFNRRYIEKHKDITELAVSNVSGKWMFGNTRFHVIPNGIDTNIFRYNKRNDLNLRRKYDISNKCNVLVSVSRLSYQKNYPKIINVFNELHKINCNTKLFIAGNGPEYSQLKSLVYNLHLENSVRFLGIINNVAKLLCMSDLMLMPSRYEGLPFSLMEAQSTGVPAVVSLEALPKSADVTGYIKYISLNKSDLYWAKVTNKMLDSLPNNTQKYYMNYKLKNSKYNLDNSIQYIRHIYQE